MHVLITVGTTSFDCLIKEVIAPKFIKVLEDLGCSKLSLQIGRSELEPCDIQFGSSILVECYRYKDSLLEAIQQADLVISHAGAGTCLEVLGAGKALVVVINEELMNNHQLELAQKLAEEGHLFYCTCGYKGRTYIGFTVNPNRRVNQHNKGHQFGGARKTSGKGPWDMVLIVHGFPNSISALRFEWAWQNPKKSRRLRHLTGKKKNENAYQYCFRIVGEMLQTSPWCRLPLTFRWLKQEYILDFPPQLMPPVHMPLQYGPVIAKKISKTATESAENVNEGDDDLPVLASPANTLRKCCVCNGPLQAGDNTLRCLDKTCHATSHTLCLARRFLALEGCAKDEVLPVKGNCPRCSLDLLWGNLIKYKAGCYQNEDVDISCMQAHWADDI